MSVTLDGVSQICVSIFGLSAIFLVAKKNKWGFVLGLLSEPFWFITTSIHRQWGIFILSAAYGVTWVVGIYEWFFKDEKKAAAK